MTADMIRQIDEALATLAIAIRAHGEHGIRVGMPFFERLERERAMLVSIDERLDRAIARVHGPKGANIPGRKI
jgi:hypothetical protein